jgi:hypothetical protein
VVVQRLFIDFSVPFLEDIDEKVKLVVVVVEMVSVELLQLEAGVLGGLEQFLDVVLEGSAIVSGYDVLEGGTHASIRI